MSDVLILHIPAIFHTKGSIFCAIKRFNNLLMGSYKRKVPELNEFPLYEVDTIEII